MNTPHQWTTAPRHISEIRAGDIIIHNEEPRTVNAQDIKKSEFMGVTIFGDSYQTGRKPVIVASPPKP
jgi:hypothetical protein